MCTEAARHAAPLRAMLVKAHRVLSVTHITTVVDEALRLKLAARFDELKAVLAVNARNDMMENP
jgi:hypothetical protein